MSEVAREAGVPNSVISRLERGLAFPRRSTLQRLASVLGFAPPSLLSAIAHELGVDANALLSRLGYSSEEESLPSPPVGMRLLKVVAEVPCGKPYEAWEDLLGYILIYEDEYPGATFALRAVGDSMFPYILHGDFVIVRRQEDVENGSIAVVSFETEGGVETTIKKVNKQDTRIVLESLNPQYPPIIVDLRECRVRIVGKVIGLKRYFK